MAAGYIVIDHCCSFQSPVGVSRRAEQMPHGCHDLRFGPLPHRFDGHLVHVQGWLVSGWEGDRFLSDPKPQNLRDGSPAYVWLYCSPGREKQVFSSIGYKVRVYGWFTGYFHFIAKPHVENGALYPVNMQFEAIEVSVPELQPASLAEATRGGNLEDVRKILD